jgi:uncharacterized protein (TIGR00369 family)
MDKQPASASASGLVGHLAFETLEWRDGLCRIALEIGPHLLNSSKILHGGVLLTMLDEAGGAAGLWCSVPGNRRHGVTISLNGQFTGRSSSGRIVATGTVVTHGQSIYFCRSEVVDADGQLLAYGTSTHKWRRGSNVVEGAPG